MNNKSCEYMLERNKEIWGETAKNLAQDDYQAVLLPSKFGLWYIDRCKETALTKILKREEVCCKGYVLDIGCGVGRWTIRLAKMGFNIVGLYISEHIY